MPELDDILSEFLVDCHENLEKLDQDLLSLEANPDDTELLRSVFRTVHTIKGNSGFLALPKLERVTHVGENLLVPVRDGKRTLDNNLATGLLSMVDAVREILSNIEANGSEGDREYLDVISRLEDLMQEPASQAGTKPVQEAPVTKQPTHRKTKSTTPRKKAKTRNSKKKSARSSHNTVDPELPIDLGYEESAVADSTVRLDVTLLDRLMNQVGELVLARNQILQHTQDLVDPGLHQACQSLNLITRELQAGVLKTRMRPISNVWNRVPRQVRDLCESLGKNVVVKMEGAETEIDKTVLEAIRGPLTHIVRNAVDHAFETPDQRKEASKPADGTLLLNAYHEGGFVAIEVSDDGRGISPDAIKQKAISNQLITKEEAESISIRELHELILAPGFSTATTVTNVSGRGIGMDVVKTNVESIGGSLDIQSEEGRGTTFRMRIPLTLAIVPALVVRSTNERYAIPQIALVELHQLGRSEIELVNKTPVFRRRGRLLPLLDLNRILGGHSCESAPGKLNIAVLSADQHQFGLIVEEICDSQEIVVKPLSRHLQDVDLFAGATIMGDGAVSLILDVGGLARHGQLDGIESTNDAHADDLDQSSGINSDTSILLVDCGGRLAIPLTEVARLEELHSQQIEFSNGNPVTQYRGEILPLLHVSGHALDATQETCHHMIVCGNGSRNVGIVVGQILDVVEAGVASITAPHRATQIIDGFTTTVIEPQQIIREQQPALLVEGAV